MTPIDRLQGPSLSEMAAGGWNHAEQWMNPGATSRFPGQSPLPQSSVEDDSPPGAPAYANGPLANLPQPTPSPRPGTTSAAAESDLPPGVGGTYYGGPLANPPTAPTPPPQQRSLQKTASNFNVQLPSQNAYPDITPRFSWSSAFSA